MSQYPAPVNPDDLGRGPLVMGLTWTFAAVAIIAVAIRFWICTQLAGRPSLDDWLMGIAVILNIVSQSFVSVSYHYGLGKHDASLTLDQLINTLKWMWIANTPGLLVAIVARVSIAVLLIKLFGVHKWFKWFLIIVTAIGTVLTLVIIPCTYLQTIPVSGNWNPMLLAKRWKPRIYIDIAFLCQALWTFTDLTFVLLPVAIVWRLQMTASKRLGLALVLSAGLFTMTLSILKTISLQHIAAEQANPTATDVQYDAALTILWSCLEQASVIIMGCVPALSSLAKTKIIPSVLSSLASILRPSKSSSSSSVSTLAHKTYGHDGIDSTRSAFSEHKNLSNTGNRFVAAVTSQQVHETDQKHLAGKNRITATTEVDVSYDGGSNSA